MSFLFGSAPKANTSTTSTISPDQTSTLNYVTSLLTGGVTPAGTTPQYSAPGVEAGATGGLQSLIDQIGTAGISSASGTTISNAQSLLNAILGGSLAVPTGQFGPGSVPQVNAQQFGAPQGATPQMGAIAPISGTVPDATAPASITAPTATAAGPVTAQQISPQTISAPQIDATQAFQQGVVNPVTQNFWQNIIPQITGKYGASAGGAFSSDAMTARSQAANQLDSQLAASGSEFAYSAAAANQATDLAAAQSNQSAALQAAQSNQSAQLNAAIQSGDWAQAASLLNAQNQLAASQSNQGAQLSTNLADLQSHLTTAQADQQTALASGQTNLAASLQTEIANLTSQIQTAQSNQSANLTAQQSNQSATTNSLSQLLQAYGLNISTPLSALQQAPATAGMATQQQQSIATLLNTILGGGQTQTQLATGQGQNTITDLLSAALGGTQQSQTVATGGSTGLLPSLLQAGATAYSGAQSGAGLAALAAALAA